MLRKNRTRRARRGAFAAFESIDEFDEPDFKRLKAPTRPRSKTDPPRGNTASESSQRRNDSSWSRRVSSPAPSLAKHILPPVPTCKKKPAMSRVRTQSVSSNPKEHIEEPLTIQSDDSDIEDFSEKRDTSSTSSERFPIRKQTDFIVVKQGWLQVREPTESESIWETLWCVLYLSGDFVYYTDQLKTDVRGFFEFLPESTIHSFDDPCRMEVVPAHKDPNSIGIHFRGADGGERSAWSAAISQPQKYLQIMDWLRTQTMQRKATEV